MSKTGRNQNVRSFRERDFECCTSARPKIILVDNILQNSDNQT